MKCILTAAILSLSAICFSQSLGDTYIIETTTPGANLTQYTANGMAVSTARVSAALFPELTAARTQSAYCTLAILNKSPQFTPNWTWSGKHAYKVEICWPSNAAITGTGYTWNVKKDTGEIQTGTFDELNTQNNLWVEFGGAGNYFNIDKANGGYVQFFTNTANGGVADSAKRFYVDAMKFTVMTLNVPVTMSGFTVE